MDDFTMSKSYVKDKINEFSKKYDVKEITDLIYIEEVKNFILTISNVNDETYDKCKDDFILNGIDLEMAFEMFLTFLYDDDSANGVLILAHYYLMRKIIDD